MSTRGFLIEILLRRYNADCAEVIPVFLFTFIALKLLLSIRAAEIVESVCKYVDGIPKILQSVSPY